MRMTAEAMERRRKVLASLSAARQLIALAEASFNAGNQPRFQISDLDDAQAEIAVAKGLLQ